MSMGEFENLVKIVEVLNEKVKGFPINYDFNHFVMEFKQKIAEAKKESPKLPKKYQVLFTLPSERISLEDKRDGIMRLLELYIEMQKWYVKWFGESAIANTE